MMLWSEYSQGVEIRTRVETKKSFDREEIFFKDDCNWGFIVRIMYYRIHLHVI